MPWQSPGGAFSRFSSISRAPGPSPCAPTQAGTPRPRPGDPRGPPARWRRLVDTPWELQGGLFSFFFYLQSPRALALCSDPGGDTSPSAGGPPRTPPLDGAALWTPSGNCRGPLSFSALQARGALGFLPGLGRGSPRTPRPQPASRPARGPPGTPGEPPAPTLSFSLYKLAARRRPVRASSRPSEPSLAAGRAGGGPRGPQPPGPAPARPGTPSGGPPGAP